MIGAGASSYRAHPKYRRAFAQAVAVLRPLLPPGSRVYVIPRRNRRATIAVRTADQLRDISLYVADITGVNYSTHRGTVSRLKRGLGGSTPVIDSLSFALHGRPVLEPVFVTEGGSIHRG